MRITVSTFDDRIVSVEVGLLEFSSGLIFHYEYNNVSDLLRLHVD